MVDSSHDGKGELVKLNSAASSGSQRLPSRYVDVASDLISYFGI